MLVYLAWIPLTPTLKKTISSASIRNIITNAEKLENIEKLHHLETTKTNTMVYFLYNFPINP